MTATNHDSDTVLQGGKSSQLLPKSATFITEGAIRAVWLLGQDGETERPCFKPASRGTQIQWGRMGGRGLWSDKRSNCKWAALLHGEVPETPPEATQIWNAKVACV
jgi:hypothetical protein